MRVGGGGSRRCRRFETGAGSDRCRLTVSRAVGWDEAKLDVIGARVASPRLASSCRSGRHQDDGHLLGGRRDPAMDRAGPRPEQKVAARSNRQQTPDTGRPGNSAHHYYPALLLGHNYNQLLLDAAPG